MPKSLRSHAASLAVAACIVILGGAVDHAGASEFIYGHTSWTAVSGNTVQFTVRGAFRRSGMPCIDLTTNSQTDCAPGDGFAQVGDVVVEDNGGTSLDPGDGNAPVGPLYYQVSAIDPTLDLLTALALDPASLPARSTTIPYTYATAAGADQMLSISRDLPTLLGKTDDIPLVSGADRITGKLLQDLWGRPAGPAQ